MISGSSRLLNGTDAACHYHYHSASNNVCSIDPRDDVPMDNARVCVDRCILLLDLLAGEDADWSPSADTCWPTVFTCQYAAEGCSSDGISGSNGHVVWLVTHTCKQHASINFPPKSYQQCCFVLITCCCFPFYRGRHLIAAKDLQNQEVSATCSNLADMLLADLRFPPNRWSCSQRPIWPP